MSVQLWKYTKNPFELAVTWVDVFLPKLYFSKAITKSYILLMFFLDGLFNSAKFFNDFEKKGQ